MARHRWRKKKTKPLDFSKYSLKRLNGIIATNEKRISAIEIVLKADKEKCKMAFDEWDRFDDKRRPYLDKIISANSRLNELGLCKAPILSSEAELIKNEIKLMYHEIEEINKKRTAVNSAHESTIKPRSSERLQDDFRRYAEEIVTAKRYLQKAQVEKSKHQRIKAMADAYAGKARKMADTIRRQLKRYDHCPYCFGPLGNEPHADHIHPVSAGGLSVEENMIFVCSICNSNKSAMTLRAFCSQFGHSRDRIEGILIQLGKRV